MISMLPESHELHIPTHEPDYTDWKLDQPPVKIVEYANFLADVVMRLITDADAEVGRWKEFLEKAFQLPPPIAHVCITPWSLVGLMFGCKIGPGAPSTESGKYKQAKVANVLIGIGAIFIAITHMMKGLAINF
jgi:hypothetical protein